jgi:hypothetical protein
VNDEPAGEVDSIELISFLLSKIVFYIYIIIHILCSVRLSVNTARKCVPLNDTPSFIFTVTVEETAEETQKLHGTV